MSDILDEFGEGMSLVAIADARGITVTEARSLVQQAVLEYSETVGHSGPVGDLAELRYLDQVISRFRNKALTGDAEQADIYAKLIDKRQKIVSALPTGVRVNRVSDPQDVDEHRGRIQSAWQKLAEAAPQVADSLIQVALNGTSESSRVAASQAVLDRIGVAKAERSEVIVRMTPDDDESHTVDPALIIQNRLKQIAAKTKVIDVEPD